MNLDVSLHRKCICTAKKSLVQLRALGIYFHEFVPLGWLEVRSFQFVQGSKDANQSQKLLAMAFSRRSSE